MYSRAQIDASALQMGLTPATLTADQVIAITSLMIQSYAATSTYSALTSENANIQDVSEAAKEMAASIASLVPPKASPPAPVAAPMLVALPAPEA